MLGKSQGVLFISLEEYSGFSKLVCGGYEQDLSDVFYLYRQGDFNWLKLKSLILSHGNVDYIPPAAYGEDLDQAQPEEIAGLLKQIGTESGYERIVVDMGHMGKGALELFAACDVVYMPVLDDPVSTAKLEDFETYLKEAGHKGMEEKIQKLHLPEIKNRDPAGRLYGAASLERNGRLCAKTFRRGILKIGRGTGQFKRKAGSDPGRVKKKCHGAVKRSDLFRG
mgnify:CR=1 FL=1